MEILILTKLEFLSFHLGHLKTFLTNLGQNVYVTNFILMNLYFPTEKKKSESVIMEGTRQLENNILPGSKPLRATKTKELGPNPKYHLSM